MCVKPVRIVKNEYYKERKWYHDSDKYDIDMLAPCGLCEDCRLVRAKDWVVRNYFEMQSHSQVLFVTLTYDNEHVPEWLHRRDVQLWLKRLRKQTEQFIRTYYIGEYGTKFGRPHYHAKNEATMTDTTSQHHLSI